jgi:hypothetical protein
MFVVLRAANRAVGDHNIGRNGGAVSVALKLRPAQRGFHRFVDEHRISAFLARRQYGKTTTVAGVALKKMMRTRGHTVVFGSAKLSLSREIVRKEAQIMQQALSGLRDAQNRLRLTENGRTLPADLDADAFAGIFEAQRLEFRFYHSNGDSDYSRTKVVALLPDTVGETGDLMLDEVGRVKNFREVWEAVSPIISSNPEFRCTLTTTPPPDDTHYSFELLAPPIGVDFMPNPEGNAYVSELGIHVLRVDAYDAFAGGVGLYDDNTGKPITPEEHRRQAHDKDAWDRNYGVKFVMGGSAACSLLLLDTAQRRGLGKCQCFLVDDEMGFENAVRWLQANLTAARVGIGVDWATTEKAVSNPTSVTVTEEDGAGFIERAVFVWKTSDPDVAEDRLVRIVEAVNGRKAGGRARRLCQDATSEKYFCERIKKRLRSLVPVVNLVGSETIERPGGERMTMKQFLGAQYVGVLEDNNLTLPPDRYLREDHRLVKRDRGSFVCDPDAQGRHGDTFDSGKNSVQALKSRGGDAYAVQAVAVGSYQGGSQ